MAEKSRSRHLLSAVNEHNPSSVRQTTGLLKMKTTFTAVQRGALFLAAVLLVPSLAHAHVGVGETSGFAHGFGHPLSGLDHICAMVAVGLWAAQMGGRDIWAVSLTFVNVMAFGGLLGMMHVDVPLSKQASLFQCSPWESSSQRRFAFL